jgi:DNA-binding transcriptional regulator YiaG
LDREEVNIIEKTCRELGVNQKQLAEKIGVSVQTLSRWNQDNSKIQKNNENFLKTLIELKKCKEFILKKAVN